ncbi:MAG: hypothetical protein J6X43_08120 [Bacteroidales bacterium]|nr:hypothetical protein [Bacteroidales bacterium]
MKKKIKIGFVAIIGIWLFACTSPEKDAKRLADKVISNIAENKDTSNNMSSTVKNIVLKSCSEFVQEEIQNYTDKNIEKKKDSISCINTKDDSVQK